MIRLLVLDVDGTMTDGGVYYDATGNEMKKFAIKDGAGLVLARTAGIRVMICTGRQSEAVRRRAADLKITDVYQNVGQKAVFLQAFMAENGYTRAQTAYCGDDLNDLAAMALCGFVACPADAAEEVKARADYICPRRCRARRGRENFAQRRALERRSGKGVRRGVVISHLREIA